MSWLRDKLAANILLIDVARWLDGFCEAVERYLKQAESAYVNDLTFGLSSHLRGHWMDRMAAIDGDIQDMERELEETADEQAGDKEQAQKARAFLTIVSEKPTEFHYEHTPPVSFQPGAPVKIEVAVKEADNHHFFLHPNHIHRPSNYHSQKRPSTRNDIFSQNQSEKKWDRFSIRPRTAVP